jgi:hypothetical protein
MAFFKAAFLATHPDGENVLAQSARVTQGFDRALGAAESGRITPVVIPLFALNETQREEDNRRVFHQRLHVGSVKSDFEVSDVSRAEIKLAQQSSKNAVADGNAVCI